MATNHKPTIAITGASGFLGTELTTYFVDKDWNVVGLVRNPSDHEQKTGVEYRPYDIAKPLHTDTLHDVDYLVHAAFVKYDAGHPDAMEINIDGARRLLKSSRQHGLKKNVFISSMSAHDEAISVYGRQKLAIEKLFDSPRDVSLRPGLILGSGGIVRQMSQFMRSKHAVPLIGGGKQPLQVVSVHDLCRTIDKALTSTCSGVLTIATPEVYTYKQFYQALARSLHIKVVFVPVPFTLLQYMFRLAALLRLPLGVGEDNLLGLKKLRAADTAPDLKKLGITLDPLDVALRKAHIRT